MNIEKDLCDLFNKTCSEALKAEIKIKMKKEELKNKKKCNKKLFTYMY